MKTNFEDYALAVIGDIHSEFQELLKIIKPFNQTLIIVAGDCGFGFPDTREAKIKNMINRNFEAFLKKRDLYLYFLRGNHDMPSFFNGNINVSTERFVLVPDYTLLTIQSNNVLCIGGAVSVDRRFRKTNISYWAGEEMLDFNRDLIKEKGLDIDVDVIISHTITKEYISYHLPKMSGWLKISFQIDKKLTLDTARENLICENIMKFYRPKLWLHGHFHISASTMLYDTKIISLNCNELYEIKFNGNTRKRITI